MLHYFYPRKEEEAGPRPSFTLFRAGCGAHANYIARSSCTPLMYVHALGIAFSPIRCHGSRCTETTVDAASDKGREKALVFLELAMPLRSYNSVSLAKDGMYSITLSDCYGIIPLSTSSSLTGTASTHVLPSSANWGHRPERERRQSVEENGGGGGGRKYDRHDPALATGRILFAPLPVKIDFRVDQAGQVGARTDLMESPSRAPLYVAKECAWGA